MPEDLEMEDTFTTTKTSKIIRIFITIPWFLPAYKAGGPIQSIANLVENFNEEIEYKIFCSDTDLGGDKLQDTKFDEWTKYDSHTEVQYVSKKKMSLSLFKKQLKESSAAILFINGIYSFYFNLLPLLFGREIRKIVSIRGMLHPGALTQKALKKKCYLLFWKLTGLHHRCEFHAADENEKKYIKDTFGNKIKIHVAQNFPRRLLQQQPLHKIKGSLQMVSIALISPMKNILLILEALQNTTENIIYNIYGSVKDGAYWKMCLKEIDNMPANIIVKYHGDIEPSKVGEALRNSHVFILPSKSENFGHAIFEALSAGRPVITSYNTPWKLLQDSRAGINVTAESIMSLMNAIGLFAAMEQDEYNLWSTNATRYADDAINFEEIKKQYKEMFIG